MTKPLGPLLHMYAYVCVCLSVCYVNIKVDLHSRVGIYVWNKVEQQYI